MNNRYSLVSYNNEKKTIIPIWEYDLKSKTTIKKEKTSLESIDLLTTNFESIKDFNMYQNIPLNNNLFIKYMAKGTEKKLPCVFNDNCLIRYFASLFENKEEISIDEEYFQKFFKQFLLACNITQMRNNIINDLKINLYIKNKINDYVSSKEEMFTLLKLKQELVKYKNLRSMILNICNYDKQFLNFSVPVVELDYYEREPEYAISRFIPRDNEEEPLFPLNSIEESWYNTYLESLPVEYSCHEKQKVMRKK